MRRASGGTPDRAGFLPPGEAPGKRALERPGQRGNRPAGMRAGAPSGSCTAKSPRSERATRPQRTFPDSQNISYPGARYPQFTGVLPP